MPAARRPSGQGLVRVWLEMEMELAWAWRGPSTAWLEMELAAIVDQLGALRW